MREYIQERIYTILDLNRNGCKNSALDPLARIQPSALFSNLSSKFPFLPFRVPCSWKQNCAIEKSSPILEVQKRRPFFRSLANV